MSDEIKYLYLVKLHWDSPPFDYGSKCKSILAESPMQALEICIGDRKPETIMSISVQHMAPESYDAIGRMNDARDTTERTRYKKLDASFAKGTKVISGD